MQASFKCPTCSNVLQAETTWSGQKTQCPYCKNTITIPNFDAAGQPFVTPQANFNAANAPFQQFPGTKDFWLIRIFNSIIEAIRGTNVFVSIGRMKNGIIQIAAITYFVLSVLLFIVACIRSADASSTWGEIFSGASIFIGIIGFAACGLYMFKLYDEISAESKPYVVPSGFINCIAVISSCACLFYITNGITETCLQSNGMLPLYKNLRIFATFFPLMIVSLAPSLLSVSTGKQSTVEYALGISYFGAKSMMFAIPFLWFYDAAYRTVNILIHLGSGKSKLAEAYTVSSEGLPLGLLYPIYAYVGYLLFDFTITAIKSLMDSKKEK